MKLASMGLFPNLLSGELVGCKNNRDPAPTSSNPIKIAGRCAEALNQLHKTDRADKGDVTWPVDQ
jgi:hypothetical protein